MNKRKILTIILGVAVVLAGFFAWLLVQRAIVVENSSVWVVPMIMFSIYAIAISLSAMLFKEALALELVLASSLLPSVFFASSAWQFAALAIGAYFLFLASHKIRLDMDLNVRISPWKSLQSGKSYLLVGLILMICAQYFLTIRTMNGQVKIPQLDLKPVAKKIVMPMLASFSPSFRAINDENLTVDQFILQSSEKNQLEQNLNIDENFINEQLPENFSVDEKEMLKKQARENFAKSQNEISQKSKTLTLQAGHAQFENLIGHKVTGNEKIADIFAGMVDKKLNDFFRSPITQQDGVPVLPIIFTVILFLTIYPISSILSILWFLVAKIAFFVFLKTGMLDIKKIPVQKEILE